MQQQAKKNSNTKTVILSSIGLIALVGVVIASINFLSEYSAEKERINQQLAILSHKQQLIDDLEGKLDSAQKDMQILVDNKPADTQAQAQELAQIKDAYFLVRIAEDRLQYANDLQTAKQLVQLAQDRLASLTNPEVAKAKAILLADQAKLNALHYPDVNETHEKLAVLDKLINDMPLKTAANVDTSKDKVSDKKKANSHNMRFDKEWKRSLNMMLEDLKSAVKVRKKTDKEVDLSYVNIEISKAQFKLLIEQIRWAIYYRDAVVYQRSVKNAQELLLQVFDVNNENVSKFSKTLNELASVQIQPNVPSIQDAVNALQALLVR